MLYAYHKTHLHTTKVVMILIPSFQGLHYIGTPETMADIACYISSVTSVNLKKAGMARRNIVIKKTIHVVMNQFCSSLWASHFGQTDEKKRLHFSSLALLKQARLIMIVASLACAFT